MKKLVVVVWLVLGMACMDYKKGENEKVEGPEIAERWSKKKAWAWFEKQPWLVGSNFNPSTSINQLEFWQEDTFDPETIDKELGWSADLGMNLHRVYLHNLLWEQDSIGFLN
ncbi:MAG: 1,4-beta-xylanase, partial [Maribacter sp.]|nr:1,4-beta-xylanase [Maribacter sp.]